MNIHSPDSRPTRPGPSDWFTGHVWIDPIINNELPSHLAAARVTFAPGARTAWHTHPLGQTLYVLAGAGLVQLHGQPPRLILPGDTVSILPNELHWHGATATNGMTHIAMQEADETGSPVTWRQQVTEEEYSATPA